MPRRRDDSAEAYGRGASLDSVLLDAEQKALDEKSSALHRAACHGDLEIMKKVVLTQPELFVVDTKLRTPLHVAAYMGKHEVFAYLISLCESPMQLELEDDTGRTPFEILAAYNPVLDTHRNMAVDELREDVFVHLQLHSLAGRFFAFRHFWFVFIPLVSLAVLSMVISFGYASTTPQEVGGIGARDKRAMALASGFLSTLCAGLHIANNGFRYKARAAAHKSAAHDLQDLKTELDFRHVAGFVTGDDGETPPIDVPGITKRLETIKRMCKSDVPTDLLELYQLLRKHLQHWLVKQRIPRGTPDYELYKDLAYTRAEMTVVHTFGWPIRCPAPKGAVKRILHTAKKRFLAAKAAAPKIAEMKQAKEGLLVLRADGRPDKNFCLQCDGIKGAPVVLADPSGAPGQCWKFDNQKHLVPLGRGLTDKRSKSGAPGEVPMCIDVEHALTHQDNPLVLFPVEAASAKWRLTNEGSLVSEIGGYAGKYLGYEEGKDKGINEGTRVVLVGKHSERKLYWKWSSVVPDLPGAAKKPRGPA